MKKISVVVAFALFVALGFSLREVCVPIEDTSTFSPIPIEKREDQILWIKTFQKKDDLWYQCKPALWRGLFF